MTPFLIFVVIVVLIVEKWSKENALKGVTFDYSPDRKIVEPNEPFHLVTKITNSSRRFVPFIRIEEFLPEEIIIQSENIKSDIGVPGALSHISSTYLGPLQGVNRSMTMALQSRGRYLFRGAKLRGGDFLGINENVRSIDILRDIVVLPKVIDGIELNNVLGGFLGDVSVLRFIMEDPVLTTGYRAYTGREPMKAISWTQSARMNELMVKQYDFTIEPSLTIILNIDYQHHNAGELIEYTYSLARYVCTVMEEKRIKYDFYANAAVAGAYNSLTAITEGLGHRHFLTILEGLGRGTHFVIKPFDQLIYDVIHKIEKDRSVILITPGSAYSSGLDPNGDKAIKMLKNHGTGSVLILNAEALMA